MHPRQTGGGQFDAEARYAYIAAGSPAWTGVMPPVTLEAVNELMRTDAPLLDRLRGGQTVMLDSGIFALTQDHMRSHPGMKMDDALALAPDEIDGFDALFAKYVEIVRNYEDQLWGYVELDQGGRNNKVKTRARLEDMGLRPIPVYHPLNDGWGYFDELASSYDRICVGNIVQASIALRVRILATIWERHRDYPHLWIHGLGYTPTPLLHAFPVDSVDSTTWLSAIRWGVTSRQVSANLEPIADHHRETCYIRDNEHSLKVAGGLASWTVHSMSCQWRAQREELAELALAGLPERREDERVPCPAA